jgi:RHS Repeat
VLSPAALTGDTTRPATETASDALGRSLSSKSGKVLAASGAWQGTPAETTYTYTASGQVATQRGALTYPVDYAYDRQGRMVSMTTYKGMGTASEQPAVTSWTYNARGLR